jgi:hypothetical protein
MVESEISNENSIILEFLDTDLYEPQDGWDKEKFQEIFQCAICLGVVIKPLECTTCMMLYCGKCIGSLQNEKRCPRRCGSN